MFESWSLPLAAIEPFQKENYRIQIGWTQLAKHYILWLCVFLPSLSVSHPGLARLFTKTFLFYISNRKMYTSDWSKSSCICVQNRLELPPGMKHVLLWPSGHPPTCPSISTVTMLKKGSSLVSHDAVVFTGLFWLLSSLFLTIFLFCCLQKCAW